MNLIVLIIFFICGLFDDVNGLETSVDSIEQSNTSILSTNQTVTNTNINATDIVDTMTISSTNMTPIVNDYWMTRTGVINDDLLHIQAVIVKDEDAEVVCTQGIRKTKKRYLMCAGSILTKTRILTSASCLHEALHIRHNVRAPLAVVIAPLKSSVQIIRVVEYRIHPKHNTNPYSPEHAKYNLAVLSLSCKIEVVNYFKIEMPTQPMAHICSDENCVVAVYRISGHTSNVILQILAPHVPSIYRRRREINSEKIKVIDDKARKIVKRYTDGSKECAHTGAAVMMNNTQTAIVAISCDDRQPKAQWHYTDLYESQDWIHNILHDWNHTQADGTAGSLGNSSGLTPKNCGQCVFNFYINIGCKAKGNCPDQNRRSMSNQRTTVKRYWKSKVNSNQKPLSRTNISIDPINNVIDPVNIRVVRYDNESLTDVFAKETHGIFKGNVTKNIGNNNSWPSRKFENPMKIEKSEKPLVRKDAESDIESSNLLRRRHANRFQKSQEIVNNNRQTMIQNFAR